MQHCIESDWRKFSERLPVWRERYLSKRNARLVEALTAPHATETDRFWDAKKMIEEEAKTLRRCLDDVSRSKMWIRLSEMRMAGMIQPEDIADFSEGLRKEVFHE